MKPKMKVLTVAVAVAAGISLTSGAIAATKSSKMRARYSTRRAVIQRQTPQNNMARNQMAAMQSQVTKMDAVVDQNKAGVIEYDPSQKYDWFRRVTLSGLMNVDASFGSRTPNFISGLNGRYGSGGSSDLALTNATLFVDADVNRYTYGHISVLYADNHGIYQIYDNNESLYFGTQNGREFHSRVTLDEGFVRLRDFVSSPFFLQAGRFYVPFGNYQRYPITETLPQQLTMTQATALELGFVSPTGWSGMIYGFRGLPRNNIAAPLVGGNFSFNKRNWNNWGAQIAYNFAVNQLTGMFDIGYLYNMADVDYISSTFPIDGLPLSFLPVGVPAIGAGEIGLIRNSKHVQGFATDGLFNYGPYDFHVNFATALARFNVVDANFNNHGAQPRAIDIGAGYAFNIYGRMSHLGAGWQHSWNSARLGIGSQVRGGGLPLNRVQATLMYNLFKNTDIGAQVRWDDDYSVSSGGTGKQAVTGILRLSVGLA